MLLVLVSASPASGQRPAELKGRVVDGRDGGPVEGARVALVEAARVTETDALGAFTLRGLEPGAHTVRVERIGYADTAVVVTIAQASASVLHLAMRPLPPELSALHVSADAAVDGVRIARVAIERSGARTAGDVVAGVPGVVVRSTGPGGTQTASVRGSDASAVLVVVDGIALNDPVTGVADLSTIPAASIESVEVLPGARSARWGPRAQAGVIVVRTRRTAAPVALKLAAGSLGARSVRVEAGGAGPFAWSAGGGVRRVGGAFDFTLPPEAGGGSTQRANADAGTVDLFAAAGAPVWGGELRLRLSGELVERGLPGKSFAPSLRAREALRRGRGVAHWERVGPTARVEARIAASAQRVRFHDAGPPAGLPYDDTTRASAFEAAIAADHRFAEGRFGVGAGAESHWQSIASTRLRANAPRRWNAGVFAHADASRAVLGGTVRLRVQARADRDPVGGGAVATHALAARWLHGGSSIQLAHRSSFNPPGLDDQFFRDAVGVEPNPDLRPERVPSEVEASAAHTLAFGSTVVSATVAAYVGDVRDMIVWSPDYRFVWSPRNVDVRRRGLEASVSIESPGFLRTLRATYGNARVVYAASPDEAQLEYRPRHTASIAGAWALSSWRAGMEARFTGERYPAAARVNALPGFWTVSADIARSWAAGAWRLDTAVHVDRLFDVRDALIFGFPDPGRVLELRLDLSRTPH